MAPVDGKSRPWKDIRSLQALITHWTEHIADYADPDRRQDAFAAAEVAIKKASGEKISSAQILTKFSKMSERNRAAEYKHFSGGYKKLFEIGPQCLDLDSLHIQPIQLNKSESPSSNEKNLGELLIHSEIETGSERETSPPANTNEVNIQSLEEQIRSIQKENTVLKEAVQARDSELQILRESRHLQSQIFSSTIKDRGPLDKEVKDRVQMITSLIRLNASSSANEYFDGAYLLPFPEMKIHNRHLYELHQQAYCFDLDDDITLQRLGSLGIHQVGKSHMIRALVGMNILQTVFRSSFPDFLHDRGSAALLYEQVVEELAGPTAREIFIQSAQYTFIKDPNFSGRIVPTRATSMRQTLNDLILPLRCNLTSDGTPQSREIWESQDQTLQDVFVQSLMLRAELRLNLDRYEFFWPPPNAPFGRVAMTSDNEDLDNSSSKETKVVITLFPGIRAWDPESKMRQRNSNTDNDHGDGCRVVVKALVITHCYSSG